MKKYISSGSWFSFLYPDAWHEFEDEPGSFLFYNPTSWTGNFRISASMDASASFADDTMNRELAEYADATRVNIGGRDYVHSREIFQESGAWYTSHFWVTGEKQMVVYITYTLPKGESPDEALKVLETLSLLNPNKPACHEVIPVRLMEIVLINEAYERTQKEVKNLLKKDFSSSTVSTSLSYLQRLHDEGTLKNHPTTWERLGRVLGCFLVEEMDGVEWVTVIDGVKEYPALCFKTDGDSSLLPFASLEKVECQLVDPSQIIVKSMVDGKIDFAQVYGKLLES